MSRLLSYASALTAAALLAGCVAVVPVPVPINLGTASPPLPARLADWPAAARCATQAEARGREAQALRRINALRAAAGVAPLATDARLRAAAQGQACDNAARNTASHRGSDGATLMQRLKREGYAASRAAENVGLGYGNDAAQAVAGWQASPGHRANLLDPRLTQMGLGYAPGGRGTWVLVMARP